MSTALATTANPIQTGCIVGMNYDEEKNIGGGNFSSYQGVVMAPYSVNPFNDTEYTVPVFFGSEVPSDLLTNKHHSKADIKTWDKIPEYKKRLRHNDYSFLIKEHNGVPFWRTCPRIHFFKPEELTVVPSFEIKHLIERLFSDHCHSYIRRQGDDENPSLFFCEIDGCPERAKHQTLVNASGGACLLFTCTKDHYALHGTFRDLCPNLKPLRVKVQP